MESQLPKAKESGETREIDHKESKKEEVESVGGPTQDTQPVGKQRRRRGRKSIPTKVRISHSIPDKASTPKLPQPADTTGDAKSVGNHPSSPQITTATSKVAASAPKSGKRPPIKPRSKSREVQISRKRKSSWETPGSPSKNTVVEDQDPVGETQSDHDEDPLKTDSTEEQTWVKTIKRKKNGSFDCRKTPSGGIASELQSNVEPISTSPVSDQLQIDESSNGAALEQTCHICDGLHEGTCPMLDPTEVVSDSVIDFSTSGGKTSQSDENDKSPIHLNHVDLSKSFARLSLPLALELKDTEPNHGLGVRVKCEEGIKARTQFGPLQGEAILEREIPEDFLMKDLWQINTEDNRHIYLSTVNPEKSNWIRYLRPAPSRQHRNLSTVTRDNQLFFITLTVIQPGEELLYWTGEQDLSWTKKRAEKTNCGGCNIKFSHPLYYRLHCSVFHDPQYSLTIRKYHCKVCGLTVLGKENIIKHATEKHDGKGAYQCQFCQKHFLRLNYLDMHRNYGCSSNPSRTRPLCKICGKKFCQPQKLKIHLRRMHNGGNPNALAEFECTLCQRVLASNNALQRHKREVHAMETTPSASVSVSSSNSSLSSSTQDASARVACEKCGRTFKNKSNLKIHMLTHSGVKPFGCKIEGCKNGFTTKQCLQFHYKRSHGLNEEDMPKIEREVPYTMTAYSGLHGNVMNRRADPHNKDGRIFRTKIRQEKTPRDTLEPDVYKFEDEEDQQQQQPALMSARMANKSSSFSTTSSRASVSRPSTTSLLDGPSTPLATEKCSLLVVAALAAAEQDMGGGGSSGSEALDMSSNDGDDGGQSLVPANIVEEDGDADKASPVVSHDPLENAHDSLDYSETLESKSSINKVLSHSTESMISSPPTNDSAPLPMKVHESFHVPSTSIRREFQLPSMSADYAKNQNDLNISSSYLPPYSDAPPSYNLYPGIDVAPSHRSVSTSSSQGSQNPPASSGSGYPLRSSVDYHSSANFRYPPPSPGDYLHEHSNSDPRSTSMDLSLNPLDPIPRNQSSAMHLPPFPHDPYSSLSGPLPPFPGKEIHESRYLSNEREMAASACMYPSHQSYMNHYGNPASYPTSSARLPPMSSYQNRFPPSGASYPYGYF
ncbi:hypothetical protein TCAL_09400 [Tigriopus californicus]|uniref:Uncharacterized protein n=1 Tax=Tigriopus californicus TaxID=6832 RepID=A0A553NVR6_TIGCA|nr:hypothetical protein TCAL_09400 [Tigriopus californicus]